MIAPRLFRLLPLAAALLVGAATAQVQVPVETAEDSRKLLAEAFDVPPQEFAKWTPADFTKKIGGYGIKHVREQMVLDGMVDGINPETVKNPTFREFVTTMQEAHM